MAKKSRGIQSIEVGGALLRALARSGEPMMLRDLAREAGMAPAKAHPYLVSFSRIGLIEQDETNGRYEIGALALELGLISLRRLSAVRIAAPGLRRSQARSTTRCRLRCGAPMGPRWYGSRSRAIRCISSCGSAR